MFKYAFIIFLLASNQMNAQNLDQFRWKNRLVLLLTDHADNPEVLNQLKIFESDLEGLKERKLKVIHLTSDQTKIWDTKTEVWSKSDGQLFQKYRKQDASFEMILIGLDGGEKLRKSLPISLDQLFAVIDAMPMRRWEIEDK